MNLNQQYIEGKNGILSPHVVSSTVNEIIGIAKKKLNKKINDMILLDVGSGSGEYSSEFAKFVKKVVGVEPYYNDYIASVKLKNPNKIAYYNVLVEDFKTKDKFDLVLCLTTLEHMPNQEKSFQKIYGLMKKNSLVYLTAPNKLWPYENHYRLPFLSWLPLPIANLYMRITGRGKSYQDSSYSRAYFGLISLLKKFDWDFEFFLPHPNAPYLSCGNIGKRSFYNIIKNVGIALIRKMPIFWIFSKGFIVIIHKK